MMKEEGNYNKSKNSRDDSSSSNERRGEEEKIPEPMIRREDSKNSLIVLLKAQTWDRESHGLQRYKLKYIRKEFFLRKKFAVYRKSFRLLIIKVET